MDPIIAVAVVSFLGVLVTAAAGVITAILTNRKEKRQTSETTMERTLRERLQLRDEQLQDLKDDLEEERQVNEVLRHQNRELQERLNAFERRERQ